MRAHSVILIAAIGFAAIQRPAFAADFDTCVLDHMQGITSDVAAISIKEACLHQYEAQLSDEVIQSLGDSTAAFGNLPIFVGGTGLYVSVDNKSGYTITQLTIGVTNRKTNAVSTYVVRQFPEPPPPGTIAMGPPKDPTQLEMLGPGLHQFYMPIREMAQTTAKWNEAYAWQIISVDGFPR